MNRQRDSRTTVILGPTTVGKTDIAFGLARHLGTEVICADKFYSYSALPEVTGQSDANQYRDVQSHLYGVLKVEESRWREDRYAMEVKSRCRSIQERQRPIVVEGCSNGLIRAAITALGSVGDSTAQPLLVGLRWKSGTNLTADCERRAAKMISLGMVQQYRHALGAGLGETYVVRKCFAREPLLAHLRGDISLSQCRSRVAQELERHARRNYSTLSRIPGVVWIEHDWRHPVQTIQRILDLQTLLASTTNHANN